VSIEQMFEIVTLGGLTSVTRTSAGQMSSARASATAGAGRRRGNARDVWEATLVAKDPVRKNTATKEGKADTWTRR
jgi:hypothetical protein